MSALSICLPQNTFAQLTREERQAIVEKALESRRHLPLVWRFYVANLDVLEGIYIRVDERNNLFILLEAAIATGDPEVVRNVLEFIQKRHESEAVMLKFAHGTSRFGTLCNLVNSFMDDVITYAMHGGIEPYMLRVIFEWYNPLEANEDLVGYCSDFYDSLHSDHALRAIKDVVPDLNAMAIASRAFHIHMEYKSVRKINTHELSIKLLRTYMCIMNPYDCLAAEGHIAAIQKLASDPENADREIGWERYDE